MKRKSERILNFIKKAGKDGRRFTEIQQFIFKINYPDLEFDKVKDRGYYCNSLCGSMERMGILDHCFKNYRDRWVINKLPKGPIHRKK